MARPREFDERVAVARAREAFWEGGTAGTSITDLCRATGLASGSIYKAWGSKAGLHRATLDDYLEAALARTTQALREAPSPRAGLDRWLDDVARAAGGEAGPAGCYAVTCALESSPAEPWVGERLVRHDRAVHDEITSAVARAVAAGELRSADPAADARLLQVLVHGVQVEARKGTSTDAARAVLRTALGRLA
ncbi:MAG: TetR/AcrR family transcriptional regulator [Kineosporiaceae bacterium]